jgi:hypothetical protein
MNNKSFYLLITILLAASLIFWGWMFYTPSAGEQDQSEVTEITMYRSEGCDCCIKWAEYLEENGFRVSKQTVSNLTEVKEENGVPGQLSSCHTALVDGYVVEGHVPAEDIKRLLRDRPDAIGIAVPGMPPNSPGMDQPVTREYQVVLFDDENNMYVYATHQ